MALVEVRRAAMKEIALNSSTKTAMMLDRSKPRSRISWSGEMMPAPSGVCLISPGIALSIWAKTSSRSSSLLPRKAMKAV